MIHELIPYILVVVTVVSIIIVKKIDAAEYKDLEDDVERGLKRVRQKSNYYTEANLHIEKQLDILYTGGTSNNPIVVELFYKDGSSTISAITKNMSSGYFGSDFTKIKCLSGHKFRFASEFEAGRRSRGSAISIVTSDGTERPLDKEGWQKGWIVIFDEGL